MATVTPKNKTAEEQQPQPQAQTAPEAPKAVAPEVKSTEIARSAPQSTEIIQVGYGTVPGFAALQRVGNMFSSSSIVPEVYRGNLPNCCIAVNMAIRLGADPLMVMQNLYIVHGRPAWSSQFSISAFNSCGRFGPIRYRWGGTKLQDDWSCTAYAEELATGKIVEGPEVTIGLAKKEGWYEKNGSKWKTIPQLMLCYRAASWLIRITAPEILMGLRTEDEETDIGDTNLPKVVSPTFNGNGAPEKSNVVDAQFENTAADELLGNAGKREVVDEKTGELSFA
jgi:hypothetical protein